MTSQRLLSAEEEVALSKLLMGSREIVCSQVWSVEQARAMLAYDIQGYFGGSSVFDRGKANALKKIAGLSMEDLHQTLSTEYILGAGLRTGLGVRYAKVLIDDGVSFEPRFCQAVADYYGVVDMFVERNVKLVHSIKGKYVYHFPELEDDLFSEGVMGVMRAAELFDGRNKFSTYATWWIRQRIKRYLQNNKGIVRAPVHVNDMYVKIQRLELEHHQLFGKVDVEALCGQLGITSDHYRSVKKAHKVTLSLDAPQFGDDDDRVFIDTLSSEAKSPVEIAATKDASSALAPHLDILTAREREVIELRFGTTGAGQLSLVEVGQRLGRDRLWVRQIEARALRKLRSRH